MLHCETINPSDIPVMSGFKCEYWGWGKELVICEKNKSNI